MDTILILDSETTSLDPSTGRLVEVGVATFSVKHGKHIRARSWLVRGETNEAEEINGIPAELLSLGDERESVMRMVHSIAVRESSAIVAHGADFDRQWFTPEIQKLPWICSCEDIVWPKRSPSRALSAVAIAHGVGVVDAHRAGPDVATLVRLFERVHEMGTDVAAMLAHASRPKVLVAADTPKPWDIGKDEYEAIKASIKDAGFRWDDPSKTWQRRMVREDIGTLPFAVREVA